LGTSPALSPSTLLEVHEADQLVYEELGGEAAEAEITAVQVADNQPDRADEPGEEPCQAGRVRGEQWVPG